MPVTRTSVFGRLIRIIPKQLSRDGIQGEHIVFLVHEVELAVVNDWRGFEASTTSAGKSPYRRQPVNILARDLIQRAIAPGPVISVEREPILRLFRRMDDTLRRDFRPAARVAPTKQSPKRNKPMPARNRRQ